MTSPQEFALLFARTLDLFRDPSAKEEQKAQFRALVLLVKTEAATIAARDGRLLVNGTMLPAPESGTPEDSLLQRLEFHAVKAISIPADPPLGEMFDLLKLLAEQPGEEDIASRLRASGTTRIGIEIQPFVIEAPVPVMTARKAGPPPPPPPPHPPPTPPRPPRPPRPLPRPRRSADRSGSCDGSDGVFSCRGGDAPVGGAAGGAVRTTIGTTRRRSARLARQAARDRH